jgi:hypothetical protein
VIGGGVVGMNAAIIAKGMEASVTVFGCSIDRMRELDIAFGGRADSVFASTLAIEEALPHADLVIEAVLVKGAKAPHAVTRKQLSLIKPTAVLVMWRPIREVASRPRSPPPTPISPKRSTGSPTTAWPTCPGRSRSPRPTR